MNHVCFYPGRLDLGGIGRLTISLAKEFARRGIKVTMFLNEAGGILDNQIPNMVDVVEGGRSSRKAFPQLVRFIREKRPCAVISSRDHLNAVAIAACRMSGLPVRSICSVHTTYEYLRNGAKKYSTYQRLWHSGVWVAARAMYPWADEVVAVSNGVADDFAARFSYPRDRVSVIYNPVYDEQCYVNPVLSASSVAYQKPRIVSAGRLTYQKGFDVLIRSFARLVDRLPNATLTIYGEGEDRAMLEGIVKDNGLLGRVRLPGYVDNLAATLQEYDIFVMSSRYEGFGNVLVEALGAGLRVVSTDCKSGPSEILENGRWGLLAGVDNETELADAILNSWTSEHDGEASQARAKAFSIQVIADQYLEVISRTRSMVGKGL